MNLRPLKFGKLLVDFSNILRLNSCLRRNCNKQEFQGQHIKKGINKNTKH